MLQISTNWRIRSIFPQSNIINFLKLGIKEKPRFEIALDRSSLFFDISKRKSQLKIRFSNWIGEWTSFLFSTIQTVCERILRVIRCVKCHKFFALTFWMWKRSVNWPITVSIFLRPTILQAISYKTVFQLKIYIQQGWSCFTI